MNRWCLSRLRDWNFGKDSLLVTIRLQHLGFGGSSLFAMIGLRDSDSLKSAKTQCC
jgi:hypothetical protein